MAGKKAGREEPTDGDILRARQVLKYPHPTNLSQSQQAELVRMYYPDGIRGTPVSELPLRQLYRIAERLYLSSCRVHEKPTSSEKPFVGMINKLKALREEEDADERDELAERLCIQLENEPDDSLLAKMLSRALNAATSKRRD